MPNLTPNRGYPRPTLTDPADIEVVGQAIDAIDSDMAVTDHWVVAANVTLSFVNGTANLVYGEANMPPGWRFVENPGVSVSPRSNNYPTSFAILAVGNVTRTSCVVHGRRADTGASVGTSQLAVSVIIAGRIERVPA